MFSGIKCLKIFKVLLIGNYNLFNRTKALPYVTVNYVTCEFYLVRLNFMLYSSWLIIPEFNTMLMQKFLFLIPLINYFNSTHLSRSIMRKLSIPFCSTFSLKHELLEFQNTRQKSKNYLTLPNFIS